jgi:hypothetical protein
MEILLESLVVEALEGLGIAKVLVVRVCDCRVLAEDVELELVGPPILVSCATATSVDRLVVGVDGTSARRRRRHDVDVVEGVLSTREEM